jgi:flagella basal body P-ring formation protein FlgA
LSDAATVKGDVIHLEDVADMRGDKSLVAQLSQIELGASPLPGNSRSVSAEMVRIQLRHVRLDPAMVSADSPAICRVKRTSQTLTGDEILQSAREFLAANLDAGEGRLVIEPISHPRDRQMPMGKHDLSPELYGSTATGSTQRVMVHILVDGQPFGQEEVSLRIRRYAKIAVAKGTISKGDAVTADKVAYEERDRMTLASDAILEGESLDGLQAVQPIMAGAPLTHHSVAEPAAIHRGDAITLRARIGGITVSTPATAMEDGRPGQAIRVKNGSSNQETRGQVVDAHTVEVAL